MSNPLMQSINDMSRERFVSTFGSVFDHATWAAEEAYECRPFADVKSLFTTLTAMVRAAPDEARRRVVRAYPGLETFLAVASAEALTQPVSDVPADLNRLSSEEFAQFRALNKAYQERFDMPFVIYAQDLTRAEVMKALEQRLRYEPEVETATALGEVAKFARVKLTEICQKLEPGQPK